MNVRIERKKKKAIDTRGETCCDEDDRAERKNGEIKIKNGIEAAF